MNEPLAERIRPTSLEEFISQEHLVGTEGALSRQLMHGNIPSMVFWGPP
ncbi:MAG: replication-associated recombination protein A, partial [Robiginitalea sp.]